jgi:hypothetical protein
MAVKTKGRRAADILKWENHPGFCRRSVKIKNTAPSGGPHTLRQENLIGYPVKGTYAESTKVLELAYATEEANITGIIIGGPDIVDLADDGTTTQLYDVLYIGPCMIDYAQIQTLDANDAAFTLATIKTALKARDMKELEEPTLIETATE